jgi:hypothetical protein
MSLDFDTTSNVDRMSGFAAGCTGAYIFVRNFVMRPAIKSCHQRCTDLEKACEWLKDQMGAKDARILALETALFTSGIPELRKAMQGVVSEVRMEAAGKVPVKKPEGAD